MIIDGKVGFTGGINLADEYINRRERFGHWKDSAILLEGDAVWSMTVMFLTMWDHCCGWEEEFRHFRPEPSAVRPWTGYVQPYTDTPLDRETVGQAVYLNMISKARKYIYITTPYLVIDVATNTALCNAAKAGVDVRIITPHIPDKRYVFEVTRAHYPPLLEAGVRIYEYTPGFIHAKNFVVDDRFATVGTVNLDYRSLFLHFEDGVWLCEAPCIRDIRKDFEDTLSVCQRISLRQWRHLNPLLQLYRNILRIFAPPDVTGKRTPGDLCFEISRVLPAQTCSPAEIGCQQIHTGPVGAHPKLLPVPLQKESYTCSAASSIERPGPPNRRCWRSSRPPAPG